MSDSLEQALAILYQSNCASLAIVTAVGYDYVLTFPSEIEYVWNKPWSWVSFLFILVRYLGCYSAIATSISGTIFIPEAGEVGYAIYVLNQFAFLLFIAAANTVMLLRVWAMYGLSRSILVILLMVFVPYIVLTTILTIITNIPSNVSTTTIQVLEFSFCSNISTLYPWTEGTVILLFIPGAVICILVIIQFVRQSVQMYRATRQWPVNQYMNLLVKQAILYFLATLIFGLVNLPTRCLFDNLTVKGLPAVLFVVSNVPLFTLTPRFILSTRVLFARNLREGQGYGIDTEFGFSTLSYPGLGGNAMVFADIERNAMSEQAEEMQMEEEEYSPDSEWQY